MAKTRAQYREHGSRYGSGDVSAEAHDLAKRWTEDIEQLRLYGFGQSVLDSFNALVGSHDDLRTSRPEAVSAKTAAVKAARRTVREANDWLGRAYSNLRALAIAHDDIESGVAGIQARRKDGLDAEVGACVAFVKLHQAKMGADAQAEALVAAGEALVPRLQTMRPDAASAKSTAKGDTEELDVLDGRLVEIISAVNSAGRKAFRALSNKARVEAYKYHALRGKPSATGGDAPADGPVPTPTA